MKICVIGCNGFVGSTIYSYFDNKHDIYGICSRDETIPTNKFDVVINCAGNAKKYLARANPSKDFSTVNIFQTILKLKFKKLIHISSIDASHHPDNNYTISKLIAEECCKLYYPDSVILRLGGLVGKNLKKNIVFDIINNRNLHSTFDSIYNYISTQEVAKIIHRIIKLKIKNKIINVAASTPINTKEIIEEAKNKSIFFNKQEGSDRYVYKNINLDELNKFFKTKSSKHYINEYLSLINKT